jgi:hypothetical protein
VHALHQSGHLHRDIKPSDCEWARVQQARELDRITSAVLPLMPE